MSPADDDRTLARFRETLERAQEENAAAREEEIMELARRTHGDVDAWYAGLAEIARRDALERLNELGRIGLGPELPEQKDWSLIAAVAGRLTSAALVVADYEAGEEDDRLPIHPDAQA